MGHVRATLWHSTVVVSEWVRESMCNSLVAAGRSGMGVGLTAPCVSASDARGDVRLTARERVAWRQLEDRLSSELMH